ncbi:lysylphosphatidylglycerol synthase transmembrane domain-containing protein [Sinorhizobium sp. BG8]|uniref:lysylphosphatidylglycerol synthase transmembrane domain-containing protein n=1 Tax=Sinorhizobium sp. BG8 TaxID=2613773 RepID=UPI00193D6CE6|nr:lysylphosphatidylglycerol synthase transmembrane domain-containing protein [Sinorhizobium sp. BG8]QRM54794.1 flippase-like domain-containing protein [Sinorhizobium sp. BG8]
MTSTPDSSRSSWVSRNGVTLLTVACLAGYGAFVEWQWGWSKLFAQWLEIGLWPVAVALMSLTATYFVRSWRIHDYFPSETAGRFLRLFRVTQVHNLLNIMLPFRAGETSFPLLMRSEFGIPLARATSALFVMRLLDLHALCAAAGVGVVINAGGTWPYGLGWIVFLVCPLAFYALKAPILARLRGHVPERLERIVEEIEAGIPADRGAFVRAWAFTVLNWTVKVLVLAWVLALMGVLPLGACFGGALGGELSSVLPLHAPGGVGTYPAGIAAGAIAFGAAGKGEALASLGQAAVNTHLLIIASAFTGTALSVLLSSRRRS